VAVGNLFSNLSFTITITFMRYQEKLNVNNMEKTEVYGPVIGLSFIDLNIDLRGAQLVLR
jgi:hypothetical protein